MLYLLAILVPPLAVLLIGKPDSLVKTRFEEVPAI